MLRLFPAVDGEPIIELGGADEMNIVKMGTGAKDVEVLGRGIRADSSAKWVKARRVK